MAGASEKKRLANNARGLAFILKGNTAVTVRETFLSRSLLSRSLFFLFSLSSLLFECVFVSFGFIL